jgi:hypothetical protein
MQLDGTVSGGQFVKGSMALLLLLHPKSTPLQASTMGTTKAAEKRFARMRMTFPFILERDAMDSDENLPTSLSEWSELRL